MTALLSAKITLIQNSSFPYFCHVYIYWRDTKLIKTNTLLTNYEYN